MRDRPQMGSATASDAREDNSCSKKYYMTDQGGQMCRWKLINKAYTLHRNDYKDPPAILVTR